MHTIVHIGYCWSPLALTRRVPLVEQEIRTILKYLSSLPFICGFVVAQSLVFLNIISTTVFVLSQSVVLLLMLSQPLCLSFFVWPLHWLPF